VCGQRKRSYQGRVRKQCLSHGAILHGWCLLLQTFARKVWEPFSSTGSVKFHPATFHSSIQPATWDLSSLTPSIIQPILSTFALDGLFGHKSLVQTGFGLSSRICPLEFASRAAKISMFCKHKIGPTSLHGRGA
jgi:hypothetical protein